MASTDDDCKLECPTGERRQVRGRDFMNAFGVDAEA